jgi:hypothetical protein
VRKKLLYNRGDSEFEDGFASNETSDVEDDKMLADRQAEAHRGGGDDCDDAVADSSLDITHIDSPLDDDGADTGDDPDENNYHAAVEIEPQDVQVEFDSDDEIPDADDEDEHRTVGHNMLIDWYGKYHDSVSRDMMHDLLEGCRMAYDSSLPRDPRTLDFKIRPGNVKVKTLSDGLQYAHIGVEKVLRHALRGFRYTDIPYGVVEIWLYVDGVRKFKAASVPGEFWPLTLRVANVDGLFFEPLVAGISYGQTKPNAKELLDEFLQELPGLTHPGIKLNPKDARYVTFKLDKVIADAPARAMLKGTVGHTAFAACERCDVDAVTVRTKRTVGTKRVFVSGFSAEEREEKKKTDKSFRERRHKGHHRLVKRPPYVRGEPRPPKQQDQHVGCVFERDAELDMIYLFPLDPMHLLYLGEISGINVSSCPL